MCARNGANAAEELNFFINLNIKSHMWLVATGLDGATSSSGHLLLAPSSCALWRGMQLEEVQTELSKAQGHMSLWSQSEGNTAQLFIPDSSTQDLKCSFHSDIISPFIFLQTLLFLTLKISGVFYFSRV